MPAAPDAFRSALALPKYSSTSNSVPLKPENSSTRVLGSFTTRIFVIFAILAVPSVVAEVPVGLKSYGSITWR